MKVNLKYGKQLAAYAGICLILPIFALSCLPLIAQVSHLPENIQKILKNTWPEAKHISSQVYYLTEDQYRILKTASRLGKPSQMHTFYAVEKNSSQSQSNQKSYGIFDSHIVRSKSQTLFFVLDAQGNLEKIEVIAFHEPKEYKAPRYWLDSLLQKLSLQNKNNKLFDTNFDTNSGNTLNVNLGIDGLSGATLTYQAVVYSLARVHFLHNIHIQKKD